MTEHVTENSELDVDRSSPRMALESGSRRGRPNDPDRRARIIDACLDVIAESGVVGASHRRIAEAAGVPLGSMTYYFSGIEDLLHEAFTRFGTRVSERFERRMTAASDLETARRAVAEIILDDVLGNTRELVLSQELYTLAARVPAYRAITTEWMKRSRRALERHFDPETARILDSFIEGISIHRALDDQPRDAAEVALAVARLTSTEFPPTF